MNHREQIQDHLLFDRMDRFTKTWLANPAAQKEFALIVQAVLDAGCKEDNGIIQAWVNGELESADRLGIDLMPGEVIALGEARTVRVLGRPNGSVARHYRGNVAVRNVATNRLSYIPESHLLKAKHLPAAPAPEDPR